MTTPIRVLIVDDHALFRSGVRGLLQRQADFAVVGEAGDGLEGLKRAKLLQPDVVLLDLHIPGISGRELVGLLAEEVPNSKVLILTVSEDAEDLLETLRAGALGYLLKNIDTDFLLHALRTCAQGESVLSPLMADKLVQDLRRPPAKDVPPEDDKLSPREKEIIGLLARGNSNKLIALTLNVAESTVKIHVQNILKKLNLSSRVQAAVYAVEHGWASKTE